MKRLFHFIVIAAFLSGSSASVHADVVITSLLQQSEAHVDGPFGPGDMVLTNNSAPAVTLSATTSTGDGDATGSQTISGWVYDINNLTFDSIQNAFGTDFGTATSVSASNQLVLNFTTTGSSTLDYGWNTQGGTMTLTRIGAGNVFSHSGENQGIDSIALAAADYQLTITTAGNATSATTITTSFDLFSASIPEPNTMFLIGTFFGLNLLRRSKRKCI